MNTVSHIFMVVKEYMLYPGYVENWNVVIDLKGAKRLRLTNVYFFIINYKKYLVIRRVVGQPNNEFSELFGKFVYIESNYFILKCLKSIT